MKIHIFKLPYRENTFSVTDVTKLLNIFLFDIKIKNEEYYLQTEGVITFPISVVELAIKGIKLLLEEIKINPAEYMISITIDSEGIFSFRRQ